MFILNALWKFIASLFVSIFVLGFGIPWSIGASFWQSPFKKGIKQVGRLFLAIFVVIAYLLEQVAISLDILWNVAAGEMLEDAFSTKNRTTFGFPHITVSASIGLLEKRGELTKFGQWFSKVLNVVFNEKQHGIDAYDRFRMIRKFDRNIKKLRENGKD